MITNIDNFIDYKNQVDYSSIGRIDEAGLSRVWKKTTESDFAFFTTFRGERTFEENQRLLQKVIKDLNDKHLGPYLIDGHYPETVNGKKVDASENSLMVVRPESMDIEKFLELIMDYISGPDFATGKIITDDHEEKKKDFLIPQESALIGFVNSVSKRVKKEGFYLMYPSWKFAYIGDKLTFNKMGEMYSKMRGKKIPFVFEGLRVPNSGQLSHLSYRNSGLRYE